jgi:tetratricopeptide (TPR) repeat protein
VPQKIQPAAGFSMSATLAAGEVHAYVFPLEQGQFADLVVDQRGLDIAARLYGPGGSLLTSVDSYSLDGTRGLEPLPIVSEAAGIYRLEIRASDPKARPGRYAILIRHVGPAHDRDRARVAAERAFAVGQALRSRGDGPSLRRAVVDHRMAIDRFLALGDCRPAADALLSLGQLHQDLGEPAAALTAFQRAATLFREAGRRREMAAALVGLGVAQVALGDTDGAVRNYRQSLAIARSFGDRRTEADALSNLARAYTVPGKTGRALELYERELRLRRELGQNEGHCLVGMGRAYSLLGDTQRAIDLFRDGLPLLLKPDGSQREAAGAWVDLGRALVRTGQTGAGLAAIQRSLREQRYWGNRTGEAVALSELGATYTILGRNEAARGSYARAVHVFRAVDDRIREATALASLARIEEEADDLRGAIESYSRVLQLSEASGRRADQAAALLGTARVRRRLDDLPGAREAAEKALDRIEALRAETVSPELRASFLATQQEYYELYVDLLMQFHRREPAAGHNVRAFEASELKRARSLLDGLAQARADLRHGLHPSLLAREAELGDQVNAAERRRLSLAESNASPHRIAAAERELRELLAQSERLRDRIRRTSPRYAALGQAHPASLKRIQAALDPDTLLLEYELGRERSYLWAVTSTSIASFELSPAALIEKAARQAFFLMRDSDDVPEPDAQLAEISSLLLGPVAGGLRKRLLIVGDGALHTLPFAALPVPGRGDGPTVLLIAEHEVLSLPSASALVALRRAPAASAPRTVAVIADPVFGPSDRRAPRGLTSLASLRRAESDRFGRLPFSRQEADAILALVPPTQSFAALGFGASRQTVLSGRLAPFGIIHFATHGVLNSRYPELSGVALSMIDPQGHAVDGFLAVHDVYRLSLPADLVVLSGCDTGLGQEVRGEGLIGLTRAFFYAGARRVLVSLWPVEDQATAELMRRFYREVLENGRRPAAALQAAQNDLRREPRWESPYSWAGFILQGDWR